MESSSQNTKKLLFIGKNYERLDVLQGEMGKFGDGRFGDKSVKTFVR